MPRKLIMCGDHPVLAFEYEPASGRALSSGEVLDPRRLPLEFTTHGKSALYARRIDEWWESRAIPSTRDGIRRVLDSLGAASTGELLDRTYGLSLSDQYWVKREDDPVERKSSPASNQGSAWISPAGSSTVSTTGCRSRTTRRTTWSSRRAPSPGS